LVYLNGQRWDGAEIPEITDIAQDRDPYLIKLEEERKKFVPMPDHIREKMQKIRNKL